MRRIVVVNLKGGCGKTTVSTHLAAAMSRSGARTALADMDRQRSALRWLALRPEDAAPIEGLDWSKGEEKASRKIERLIVDCPAGFRGAALDEMVKSADVLVTPLLPSVFDEMATLRFLKRLDRIKAIRKGKTGAVLVANRYRKGGRAAQALEAFIEGNGRELTARLSERAAYADLAARGLTAFDLNTKAAAALIEEWMPLIVAADRD